MTDQTPTSLFVPDTSVVLKWYLHAEEPGREQAMALLQAYLEGQARLLVPSLLPYEAANVLRYKPDWDAARVAMAVESLFALGLEIVPVSAALVQHAVALACTHDVAVYDAAFVALAEESGADFVTADERLARKLKEYPHVRSLKKLSHTERGLP